MNNDLSYPLTFTNFIIENFTLGQSEDYNALFKRFFGSEGNYVWSVAILKEFEDGLITEKQLTIIMFIASAYGNRTLMDAGSDIPELTLSYECSRLKANIHNAMEKDSLSRNEIVRLFKRYNDLAAKAEKSINKNIPECIFMKVMSMHSGELFRGASYLIVKNGIKCGMCIGNAADMVAPEIFMPDRFFNFNFNDFLELKKIGYDCNDTDLKRHQIITGKGVREFGTEKLYNILNFLSRMIDDLYPECENNGRIQRKLKKDMRLLKYIERQ